MDTISKYDSSSLKIESAPVIPTCILTLDELNHIVEQYELSRTNLDEQILYYKDLLKKAGEFELMSDKIIDISLK